MSASVNSASSSRLSTASRGIDKVANDFDLSSERKYPSVKDYYYQSSSSKDKPIQYQNGLSNFSSLQLGDDRIQFTESIMSATYRSGKEDVRPISPSKNKTRHLRQREYEMARAQVAESDLDRLERVMKDKLQQRSEHVSSPFQIRKALKFFDTDKSGYISLEDFAHALEFLGFQFQEQQNMALFARYDSDYSGGIDYMQFISKAMFDDPMKPSLPTRSGAPKSSKNGGQSPVNTAPVKVLTEAEMRAMQEVELKRVFAMVSRDRGDSIDRSEFELLLMALGFNLSPGAIDGCISEIFSFCAPQCTDGNRITLAAFCTWWIDKDSMYLYQSPSY